jgi:hypothetical protein
MSDTLILVAFLGIEAAVSVGGGVALARLKPEWRRRGVLVPALALPATPALLCAFVIGKALVAEVFWPNTCGVDACGMAMMVGLIGLFATLGIAVFGLLLSFIARRFAVQRRVNDIEVKTFE